MVLNRLKIFLCGFSYGCADSRDGGDDTDNFPDHIIIPNKKIVSLNDVLEEDSKYLSEIFLAAKHIAQQFNIHESGYRLITNCNKDGGQEVDYLHFHLVGGVKLGKMISLPKSSKKLLRQ